MKHSPGALIMNKLRRILTATVLTLSLATVSFGGTIIGSRSVSAGSRTGTIVGSRTGTIVGSRTGTILGSRTGTILGSRAGTTAAENRQTEPNLSSDDMLSRVILFVLGWSF